MKKNLLLFVFIFVTSTLFGSSEIFISPSGSDSQGDGSAQKPFASLARAIAKLKKSGDGEYIIRVAEGDYSFERGLYLTKQDIAKKKISILGERGKVRFVGGKVISAKELAEVKSAEILSRLPDEREGKLYVLDLKKFGIRDYGKLSRRGWGYGNPPLEVEAFKNFQPLIPSRFPNVDRPLAIGKVLDRGTITHDISGLKKIEPDPNPRGATFVCDTPRISRWVSAENPWIMGNLSAGWAYEHTAIEKIDEKNKTIKLRSPSVYGVWSNKEDKSERGYVARADLNMRGFHIFNLLEEVDVDGEYYIDREKGLFYVMLKSAPNLTDTFAFSVFNTPILTLSHCENFKIDGIEFVVSRDCGLRVTNGKNLKISNCRFACCKLGANIFADKTKLTNCVVEDNATGGMRFGGGSEKTLTDSHSEITQTLFQRNALRRLRGSCALALSGVGVRVANCEFRDHPDHTFVHYGSRFIVERNVFTRCCQNASDMGVIYGGGISARHGTVIRENFFSENVVAEGDERSMIAGVYVDEGGHDVLVERNIFCRTGTKAHSPAFGAIYIHGGSHVHANSNAFINCDSAFGSQPWTDKGYAAKLAVRQGQKQAWELMTSELYKKACPNLEKVLDASAPRINYAKNNRLFNTSMAMNGDLHLRGNNALRPNASSRTKLCEIYTKKNWSIADVKKHFGEDALIARILKAEIGITEINEK